MRQFIRTLGVAALAVALLNASAGLCFCHRGPVAPGAGEASGGCCHGPDASGKTVVKAASSCCQIESADAAATPVAAVQLAPPAALVANVAAEPSAVGTFPSLGSILPGSSPPLFILRI